MTEFRFHELTQAEKDQITAIDFGPNRVRPSLTDLRYRFRNGRFIGYRWISDKERERFIYG